MNAHLTVIGCGVSRADLTQRHVAAVQQAQVLAGGRRLLDWFPDFSGKKVRIGADAAKQARSLARMARLRRVAVLASGDGLFFGVARLFKGLLPPESWSVLPNVTAAQSALAELRLPWERARFFSIHGRKTCLPWRAILQADPAVVYTDPVCPASSIARELIRRWPAAAARQAALAQNLGAPSAGVTRGALRQLAKLPGADLSILIVMGDSDYGPVQTPPLALGLPDDAYAHERGLITHPEVRAVALAKLCLGPGVMWDIGAGSGSVGIEASCLCPELQTHAVERKAQRFTLVQKNARAHGADNLVLHHADALSIIPKLPEPRCVFVGGGGEEVAKIVAAAFRRLRPGGALVATAVLQETQERLRKALPARPFELVELTVRRARSIARSTMFEADHAIQIFTWRKT